MLKDWKKKEFNIHSSNKLKKNTPTIPITYRSISLPTNAHKNLYDKSNKLGIPIVQTALKTIKNLTNISKRTSNTTTSHAGIYLIPGKDSNKHYISETKRTLEKKSTNSNDQLN